MPRFLSTWLHYRTYAHRGQLLEQAVARAGGDMQMVDDTLERMVRTEVPFHLSVRRQVTTDVYGLFLPCRAEKRKT